MTSEPAPVPHSGAKAFRNGLRAAIRSIFFYVVLGNYLGIGALSHEFGFDPFWMVLCTLLIWAAPAQVILISTLGTASLIEVAIAVSLSSVRLLPMVASLLPMLQGPTTRHRDMLLPTHFTAISVWAEGMRLLPGVAKDERTAFYNGIGCGLLGAASVASAIGFYLAGRLPLLMSVCRNARTVLDAVALGLGLVLGPVIAAQHVKLDLLWTGLIAGTIAYAAQRLREATR